MRCVNIFAKYPVAIWFILGNELCERFNFYGMRTVLSVYLKLKLGLSEDSATMIFHVFVFLVYFFPLFGAILADSFLGKFKTILSLSIVYTLGSALLAVASAVSGQVRVVLTAVGLIVIAVGTGGIKPIVSAFGGCQFDLPAQAALLSSFFGIFYFCINFGAFVSTFVTPVLKTSNLCGSDDCYPAAFGLPAILMLVATVIFVCGRRWYIMDNVLPEGNVVVKATKCSSHAVMKRIKDRRTPTKRDHWLDYGDDKYDTTFIGDIKQVLHVLHMLIPVPIFWALYDQQGSRWTFQALSMYGGFFNEAFTMTAEQMQIWNPLLILALIPLFQYGVYPLFAKCNLLVNPLQRMGVGMLLAALSFLVSAILETQIESAYAAVPGPGIGQLRVLNGLQCDVTIRANIAAGPDESMLWTTLAPAEMWQLRHLEVDGNASYALEMSASCAQPDRWESVVYVTENKANMYIVEKTSFSNAATAIYAGEVFNDVDKSDIQKSKLGVIYIGDQNTKLELVDTTGEKATILWELSWEQKGQSVDFQELRPSTYTVQLASSDLPNIRLESAGVYILALTLVDTAGIAIVTSRLIEIAPSNQMHMLWQLPQIVVITVGELLFSISGLEFAFTQAPVSMKSLISAAWLLTTAFGNVIVAVVAHYNIFERQMYEFLLFAFLMVLDTLLFVYFAYKYKYANIASGDSLSRNASPTSLAQPAPAAVPKE